MSVHGRKVGCPFLLAFFPLQQLSVASTIEVLPRPCCSLPHSLSSRSYWDSPKPRPTSSVMAKGQEITSKAKPSQLSNTCLTLWSLSLAWSDLWGNPWCPESLFWRAWFGMLPLALKQPESCDVCRYGLCTEVPWMHPLEFQPSQQSLLYAGLSPKCLPACRPPRPCCHAAQSARWARVFVLKNGISSFLSRGSVSLSSKDEENRPDAQTYPPKCNAQTLQSQLNNCVICQI